MPRETKEHRFSNFIVKGDYKVIDCEICKFKHLFPLPTKEALEKFYKDHYEESTPSPNFEDKKETITSNVKIDSDRRRRILDIGCWDGSFLELFPEQEWEREGIEPNKRKAALAEKKGIKVSREVLEKANLAALGKFDAVNLSFVLEHLRNPKEIMNIVFHKLLYNGGIVCAEVPNDFNPLQDSVVQSLGVERWWVSIPDHINYFNFDSLERMLKDIGYKIIFEETSFPMELFLLMGDNFLANPSLGKQMHQKRLKFEDNLNKSKNSSLKRELYKLLPRLNIGRSAIIYAAKP